MYQKFDGAATYFVEQLRRGKEIGADGCHIGSDDCGPRKYATSLNQLSNGLPVLPKFQFEFSSEGANWSLSVPQHGLFAGNYLLTTDHLYFNSVAAPSTNDVDLRSRK